MTEPADCPFCRYVRYLPEPGTSPYPPEIDGRRFYRTAIQRVMCFEPLNPVTPGHMLFVPHDHVEHSDSHARSGLVGPVMYAAYEYAHRKPHAAGFNLILNAGAAATQTVDHFHVHYVPRRDGDGLALPWTGQENR